MRKSNLAGEIPIAYSTMTTGSNHGRTLHWVGQAIFQSDRHFQHKMIALKLFFYNYTNQGCTVFTGCTKPRYEEKQPVFRLIRRNWTYLTRFRLCISVKKRNKIWLLSVFGSGFLELCHSIYMLNWLHHLLCMISFQNKSVYLVVFFCTATWVVSTSRSTNNQMHKKEIN